MSMKYHDLMKVSDEKLIELYDKAAEHTVVGISYYMEELARRRSEKAERLMLKYTKWIALMTVVMLLSTIANVIIAILR